MRVVVKSGVFGWDYGAVGVRAGWYSIACKNARETPGQTGLPMHFVGVGLCPEKQPKSGNRQETGNDRFARNLPRVGLQHLKTVGKQDSRRHRGAEIRLQRRTSPPRRCASLPAPLAGRQTGPRL